MECRIPMRSGAAKILLAVILAFSLEASVAEETVVLVVSSDSPIEELSLLNVRKAYLGLSVGVDGGPVRPLRRQDDERLNLIFMQSVVAMSEKSYERRLLSLVLKFGTPRPTEVKNRDELLELLARSPHSIGYMWKRDADSDDRVKTIRTLWQGR